MKDILLKLYDCNQKLIIEYELGRNRIFKVNVATSNTQCLSARSVEEGSDFVTQEIGTSELQKVRASEFKESGTWNS